MYRLVFSNSLDLNDTTDDIYSIEINSKLDYSKLNFGTVSSVSLTLKLNNQDKRFSKYIFKNKSIQCYINDTKKYKFYIEDVKMKNGYITIDAYDKIAALDKKFKGVDFPITLNNLIIQTLNQANLSLSNFMFTNQGFVIQKADLTGKTCREVLGYCMELCGGIGVLDENENFVIRWFNTSNPKKIDINTFVSYSSDEDDVVLNNIRYTRGSKTYNSNSKKDTKGTINLTSDNPLLTNSTSSKIQSIISNLSGKYISYFPCKVQVLSIEKYALGDCLYFQDEDGNKKIILVSNISIKNKTYIEIESLSIDTSEENSEEDSEEEDNKEESSSSYNFMIKNIINKEDVEFSECNKNTKILVNCTMTFTDATGNISFTLDNNTIRTYQPYVGTNTFTFVLDGSENDKQILSFVSKNKYTYIEYSFIYTNCLIIDYDEKDKELDTGEVEINTPTWNDAHGSLYFNVGIERWIMETITNDRYTRKRLYWAESAEDVKESNKDNKYVCALYSTKLFDNFIKLKDRTYYIKLEISGTMTGYISKVGNVEYTFQNTIPDGSSFCYSIERNGNKKYYKSSTGIIKVKDGDIVSVYYNAAPTGVYYQFDMKDMSFSYTVLDEDITGYSIHQRYYIENCDYTFGDETENVKSFNAINNYSDGTIEWKYSEKTKNTTAIGKGAACELVCDHFYDEGYTEYIYPDGTINSVLLDEEESDESTSI